jgi:hypothetical protein
VNFYIVKKSMELSKMPKVLIVEFGFVGSVK